MKLHGWGLIVNTALGIFWWLIASENPATVHFYIPTILSTAFAGYLLATGAYFLIGIASSQEVAPYLDRMRNYVDFAFMGLTTATVAATFMNINRIAIVCLCLTVICGIVLLVRGHVRKSEREVWFPRGMMMLIAIVFILSRLLLPVFNTTSYVDEYYHIISAQTHNENGHFPSFTSDSGPYERGVYVTTILSYFFRFFGTSLLTAKMLPALIGIINFCIVFLLARKLLRSPWIQTWVIAAYTAYPWVIFNDFFIRFFVFYEFFFLIGCYAVVSFTKEHNWRRRIWYVLLGSLSAGICFFLSHDDGRYFVLAGLAVAACYLFVTERVEMRTADSNYISSPYMRLVILSVLGIGAAFFLDIPEKIRQMNEGVLGVVTSHNDYFSFFFVQNAAITSLFLLGIIAALSGTRTTKTLGITASIMLFIFFGLSENLQAIRIILFFIPIWLLIAGIGLSALQDRVSTLMTFGIGLMTLGSVFAAYPTGFLDQIGIPNEFTFHEYERAGSYLQTHCIDAHVLVINIEPQIFNLYVPGHFFTSYIESALLHDDTRFSQNDSGRVERIAGHIPVLDTTDKVRTFISGTDNCIVMNNDYANNWRYIAESDFSYIKSQYTEQNFGELSVYTN